MKRDSVHDTTPVTVGKPGSGCSVSVDRVQGRPVSEAPLSVPRPAKAFGKSSIRSIERLIDTARLCIGTVSAGGCETPMTLSWA